MGMFEAAMRREYEETGRISGFGAMSSAAWTNWARDDAKRRAERPVADVETYKAIGEEHETRVLVGERAATAPHSD